MHSLCCPISFNEIATAVDVTGIVTQTAAHEQPDIIYTHVPTSDIKSKFTIFPYFPAWLDTRLTCTWPEAGGHRPELLGRRPEMVARACCEAWSDALGNVEDRSTVGHADKLVCDGGGA
jgi:hypothetical protein